MRHILLIIGVLIIIGIGSYVYLFNQEEKVVEKTITNFEECVDAGNPVMESYPRQCRHDGELFVEDIGNDVDKNDIIRLFSPQPNEVVSNPLSITGEARGQWFFEGDFPIILTDWDGRIIGEHFATAQREWMTEEFVPFSATIDFVAPLDNNRGSFILQKANASGLPQHDDAFEIPIIFEESKSEKNIRCSVDSRKADTCIQVYQPVCGTVNVQCITTPCDPVYQTFSNSCEACKNSLVDGYVQGECL